jgi:Tol biopolymer transport system component
MSITLRVLSAALAFSAVSSSALPAQSHGAMYHFPQWSPDGHWILVSATLDGDSELYLISPDGAATKKLTDNSAR